MNVGRDATREGDLPALWVPETLSWLVRLKVPRIRPQRLCGSPYVCWHSVELARARGSWGSWSSWLALGVQAGVRYWLMSPLQVVCRWIGWPGLIGVTFPMSLGARWLISRCG
jgi:hypothetical protein